MTRARCILLFQVIAWCKRQRYYAARYIWAARIGRRSWTGAWLKEWKP